VRLVVDTNLMIRALRSPGPARRFFKLAPFSHVLVYHPEQILELRDVAARPGWILRLRPSRNSSIESAATATMWNRSSMRPATAAIRTTIMCSRWRWRVPPI
jgi:hypothetical protein